MTESTMLANGATGAGSDKVKVAIRVRPFNRREAELKTNCVVEVKGDQTLLHYVQPTTPASTGGGGGKSSAPTPNSTSGNTTSTPTSGSIVNNTSTYRPPKTFTFDHCFWSFDENDSHYASQEDVFRNLGLSVLDSAFQGYNACIFAYGQTGSGKSYTMMGSPHEKGLIPRLCDSIFERIRDETEKDPSANFKLEVSYMEIYNEKVHDLLDPAGARQSLKVREHNILGPYVDGLSTLAVSSFEEIDSLMAEGNKSRTVAATNMNSESSRSHAVFTLTLTCSVYDSDADVRGERASKMSLVDLAGSERAIRTGAVGERLKEGSNINKSLTTLGLVISKLADQASGKNKREQFVPYRDSVLTWLLKDNLGGNSKTIMISTISPAADSYEETLSTLRYADRAKRIVNHAVINEDPNNRIIRELREEVEQLREQLMHATVQTELRERLVESEKLIRDMEQTWEEKLRKTEKIHQERQQALEKMGISVQSSGIAVEKDRYYLVNLNADPSMNALLVYYLKELTLIGRPDSEEEQDIQLSGVGIMPEHAIIEIDKERNELWMETINGARTYVNGVPVQERVKLRNGDRILWGNNHFFSLNCPATRSTTYEDNGNNYFDYNYARDEMLSYNNPDLEAAMFALERQFEEPSFRAPNQNWSANMGKMPGMSPMDGSNKFGGSMYGRLGGSSLNLSSPAAMATYMRMEKLAQEREENFRISLANLREEIAKANTLAHEANLIAEEMRRNTEFKVTLQIPAANLSPNRLKRGVFVSEPAILVKRKNCPSQVWSMEKFDSNLIEMRELYAEWKERRNEKHLKNQNSVSSDTSFESDRSDASPRIHQHNDPFYEFQESHLLIGVANIFLEVLMQEVMLDYQVPIISQQGEVAGRLHVEFGRIEGDFGERMADASASDADASSDDASNDGHFECSNSTTVTASTKSQPLGANQIRVRLNLKSARGLPLELSNFVFCQYSVWGYSDLIVITPVESDFDSPSRTRTSTPKPFELVSSNEQVFYFDHHRDFIITLSEEFRELCTDGALSIEVWGHRISANNSDKILKSEWGVAEEQMKISRSLSDRWLELKKKVELWVEIHELNEQGEYTPVEVQIQPDIYTGGVYQLRQGQQRRISVRVMQVPDSGTLPFVCESVRFVAAGCVCVRARVQKSLDSYQEGDLNILREKWSEILQKRQAYLQEQINELMSKTNKSQEEIEREHHLMNQWVSLVEERKAAKCPSSGSEIPGAPDDHWEPPLGMEVHIPVIYLDLNTDELNLSSGRINEVAGANSILPKEHNGTPFVNLSIVSASTAPMDGVSAVAVWDSSLHESPHLNRITATNERIFLILKVCVRLSHPANMELVLRKRIAINVYKKQSFTKNIFKRISRADMPLFSTGLTYEIVSSIPKASEDIEDRESLALLAASGVDLTACDGESYIERYTKSVSAVESILTLDRLRQEVAVREQIAKKAKVALQTSTASPSPGYLSSSGNESLLRKTLSVPNMAQFGPLQPHRAVGQVTLIGPDSRNQTLVTSTQTGSIPRGPITDNGGPRYDSSFDLSYLTSAADRLRQKASSLFGSMTGLNQLGGEIPFTEEPPHSQPTKNYESSTRGSASAVPTIGSLVSPASGKSRKPMCTVLEEQNDEGGEATRQLASNQVRVHITPPGRQLDPGDESDGEDTCYIVFEPPRDHTHLTKRMQLLDDEDDEVDRYVKLGNNLRVDSCTPTLSIASSTPHSESALGSMPSSTGSCDEDDNGDSMEHARLPKADLPGWMVVGESVRISPDSKLGTIAYIGETEFAPGIWIGVELDTPTGKNDGTVNGVQYFLCKPKFGIFVKPDKLKLDSRGRQIRSMTHNKLNGR